MGKVQRGYELVHTRCVDAVLDALELELVIVLLQMLTKYLAPTGQLTQNELYLQIGHLFSADPNIERLHNQLISAILGNVTRDHPEQGVAPWVSANDKPTMLSKPVVGDAAEQRLKMEVMAMPARDRRRLKEIPEVSRPRRTSCPGPNSRRLIC